MVTFIRLFILCSVLTPALCCDWLRHYSHHANISMTLIRTMGGSLTEEDTPLSFPYKLYTQIRNQEVESQLLFIRDSLQLISDIYHHDNHSCITWDVNKVDNFLMSIERQIDGLNTCVSTNKTTNVKLRKYYRRLATSTLHRTGSTPASWELIRKETKLHLDQLQLLVAYIKVSAGANRRPCALSPCP